MFKSAISRTGAILIAVLFALTGCGKNDTISGNPLTGVTFTVDGVSYGNGDTIFLRDSGDDSEKTLVAVAQGGTGVVYEWSVTGAAVQIVPDAATVTVTAVEKGSAAVTLTADDFYNKAEITFYVNVVGDGDPMWTFRIFAGTTEIPDDGQISIPAGLSRTVNLQATTVGVTYVRNSNDTNVWFTGENASSFDIHTGPNTGTATVTVSGTKEAETITKTFTVNITEPPPVGVVIWEWKSTINPVSVMNPGYNGTVFSVPAYPNMYVRAFDAGQQLEIQDGGFRIGSISGATALLILGGGNSTAQHSVQSPNPAGAPTGTGSGATLVTTHIPGQLDLSQGTFRLTIEYKNPETTGGRILLRVQINNNTGSNANSVLGGTGSIRAYSTVADLESGLAAAAGLAADEAEPGKIAITFTPSVRFNSHPSLENAFIALMSQGGGTTGQPCWITITGIKLEKIVVPNPPTGLAVYEGDSASGTPLESGPIIINAGESRQFTASAAGATSYNWTIASGSNYVSFKDDIGTGPTVTIEGKAEGTATINVTASNGDGSVGPFSFQVNVEPVSMNLAITDSSDQPVSSPAAIQIKASETFTVTGTGDEVGFIWEITEGSETFGSTQIEFVEFVGDTTSDTVTINALAEGRARITVTAEYDDNSTDTAAFYVDAYYESEPIWVWDNTNKPPTNLTTGQDASAFSVDAYPDIFLRNAGNSNIGVENNGFRLNGNSRRLMIGVPHNTGPHNIVTNVNHSAVPTAPVPSDHLPGLLDFSEGIFRLTLNYANFTRAESGQQLRIFVNNNTTSTSNSVLGTGSELRSVSNTSDFNAGNVMSAGLIERRRNGVYTLLFEPEVFFAGNGNIATLETAFITLFSFGQMSITGIRLEKLLEAD